MQNYETLGLTVRAEGFAISGIFEKEMSIESYTALKRDPLHVLTMFRSCFKCHSASPSRANNVTRFSRSIPSPARTKAFPQKAPELTSQTSVYLPLQTPALSNKRSIMVWAQDCKKRNVVDELPLFPFLDFIFTANENEWERCPYYSSRVLIL